MQFMNAILPFRAAAPRGPCESPLGLLAELEGAWTGRGFNLIAVPDKQTGGFRLLLNATLENLQFTAIASPVPDRGSEQGDITIFGLTYLQRLNDAQSLDTLHIETGMWLNVPATTSPPGPASIVRQSAIPHGNSLLAQGLGRTIQGGPDFSPVSSKPYGPGPDLKRVGYLDAYLHSTLPDGMKQAYVTNMNSALADAIAGQEIVSNVVLQVASNPVGGIVSIPFAGPNAKPTSMNATFWIETVRRPDGTEFVQLQYSQTVILDFLDIAWPHISVGTLIRT
jgi:hypothetical protein